MDENALKAVIAAQLARAVGTSPGSTGNSEISEARNKALQYYFAEPFGTEIDGRSEVISSDVQTVVDQELASLVEIFFGGDQVAECQPSGKEDVEYAKQATDYIQYIWDVDNHGYRIGYEWFKDALIQKNGFVRIEAETVETTRRETYTGLDDAALGQLLQGEDVTPVEYSAETVELMSGVPLTTHSITVSIECDDLRIRIAGVAPEDVSVAPRTIDLDDTEFVAWRWRKTRGQLIDDGYDKELVLSLPKDQDAEAGSERQTRFADEQTMPTAMGSIEALMEHVSGRDCYIRIDYDDDGRTELRKVVIAGVNASHILENEEVDEQPLVSVCPNPIPHKLFGQSEAERVMQEQLVKSTLQRQLLDNIYQINNNRAVINDRIDMSDFLTNRVGGAVRADGEGPVGDAYMPVIPTPIGDIILPALQYADQQIEAKTGQNRFGAGLDPDALNKQAGGTASGMNMIMTASQKRLMLIARNFAEGGVKTAFRKILKLVVAHQDQPRMIRLRGEFVPMDPRRWNAEMDVKINVGLGYGSREQQAAMIGALLQHQLQIVTMQGGISGPLVFAEHVFNAESQFIQKAVGYRNSEMFIADPGPKEEQSPPQPQPDPEMVKAQAQMEVNKQKAELDARNKDQEHQLKLVELQADMQRDREKWQIEREKLLLELQVAREKAQIDVAKAGVDMQLKQAGQAQQIEFDREKHSMQMEATKAKGEGSNGKSNGVAINLGGEGNDIRGITDGLAKATDALVAAARRPKRIRKDKDGAFVPEYD